MITKERLEELIKEEATIYVITHEPFIAGVSSFIGIKEEKLSKESNIGKDNTLYWQDMGIAELEYLYETKEEAEWYLEFGNITRTERLELPSWEEFKEIRFVEFFYNEYDYMLQYQNISKKIALYERNNKGDYYLKEATKENYLEACKMAKKLFLGE